MVPVLFIVFMFGLVGYVTYLMVRTFVPSPILRQAQEERVG